MEFAENLKSEIPNDQNLIRLEAKQGLCREPTTTRTSREPQSGKHPRIGSEGLVIPAEPPSSGSADRKGEPRASSTFVMETYGGQECLLAGDEEEFLDLPITLDSGAAAHVTPGSAVPGYVVEQSPASRVGGGFVDASGHHTPNEGQVNLSLEKEDTKFKSIFQVAEITQTLWAVGQICDQGHDVLFTREKATVLDGSTRKPLLTVRRGPGGLYKDTLRMRNPRWKAADPKATSGFTGPG